MRSYQENINGGVSSSHNAFTLTTVDGIKRNARIYYKSGRFLFPASPINADNYPNNTSKAVVYPQGCTGAGMDRVYGVEGCWMHTEPPNGPKPILKPGHGMIGMHPAGQISRRNDVLIREKLEEGLLHRFD